MPSTTQQFASVTGVAVIGALFFTALGTHPGRAEYAHAAELALWAALDIVLVMTILVEALAHATVAAKAPATEQ